MQKIREKPVDAKICENAPIHFQSQRPAVFPLWLDMMIKN